jgi:nicotine oxidoreductase
MKINIADVKFTSKGLLCINKLRVINKKSHELGIEHINKRIYRILYCQDVYICAYEKIKSNKGAVTESSDKTSLDGMSIQRINKLIELIKTEKWNPRPARRIFIPKENGKTRPLGIQGPEEKIIQEIVRMILEAIYETNFLDCSHGFRKDKGCLTALNYIRQNFDGVSYIIEGDITKCYDSFNHQILVTLLQRRIRDQKFINLIFKLLKAGYIESDQKKENNILNTPKLGTPQGSILSPFLANIYLHELDKFIIDWIKKHSKPRINKRNPKKLDLIREIRSIEKQLDQNLLDHTRKSLIKRIKELKIESTKIPYMKSGLKAYYVRYADDWIIGINGPASNTKKLKNKINKFLHDDLDLTLNLEKTKISDMKAGNMVLFLGYEIKWQPRTKIIKMRPKNRPTFYKQTTGHKIKLCIPHKRIVHRLFEKGYCDVEGFPLAYKKWSVFDDIIILKSFNAVRAGLLNYYTLADNSNIFFRIDYILRYSLAKTLAHRHQSSIKKIFQKHGKTLIVKYKNSKDKIESSSMPKFKNFNPKLKCTPKYDPFEVHIGRVTRSKLGRNCCICGFYNGIEMHHIKHIRNRKNTKEKQTFSIFMGLINRKQVPVCRDCHLKIHKGEYNSIKLAELSDSYLAKQ